LERIWKRGVVAESIYYPGICLEGLRKSTKTLRIACVQKKIQTGHFSNTSIEKYVVDSIGF
jgi:hypothetical protein